MKKSLILVGLLSIGYAHAQQYDGKVGVNTETPSATLNVKSKTGTSEATKNLELQNADNKNLVTVLDNGNVGIGTDVPVTNLQINSENDGTIRIKSLQDVSVRKSRIDFVDKDDRIYAFLGDNSKWDDFGIYKYDAGNIFFKVSNANTIDSPETKATTLQFNSTGERRIVFSTYNEDLIGPNKYGVSIVNDKGYWGIGAYVDRIKDITEQLVVRGGIKIQGNGTYFDNSITITHGATTPVPAGGAGTMIFNNGHFYGWTSDNAWQQLDNTQATTGATQLSGTDGIECNDANRGKMNFKKNDSGSDVFGICMRNKDGNYYWAYMVGGNNPTNGTGTFGNGLQ